MFSVPTATAGSKVFLKRSADIRFHSRQVVEELVGYLQAARMLAAAAKTKQPPTAELAALAADGAAAEAEQEMEIDGERLSTQLKGTNNDTAQDFGLCSIS